MTALPANFAEQQTVRSGVDGRDTPRALALGGLESEDKRSDVYCMQGIRKAVALALLPFGTDKGTTFHPRPSKILIDL